jgi:hypothetical protein
MHDSHAHLHVFHIKAGRCKKTKKYESMELLFSFGVLVCRFALVSFLDVEKE